MNKLLKFFDKLEKSVDFQIGKVKKNKDIKDFLSHEDNNKKIAFALMDGLNWHSGHIKTLKNQLRKEKDVNRKYNIKNVIKTHAKGLYKLIRLTNYLESHSGPDKIFMNKEGDLKNYNLNKIDSISDLINNDDIDMISNLKINGVGISPYKVKYDDNMLSGKYNHNKDISKISKPTHIGGIVTNIDINNKE